MNLGTTAGAESLLSGGLAMALTYINRVKMNLSPAEKINPRYLDLCKTAVYVLLSEFVWVLTPVQCPSKLFFPTMISHSASTLCFLTVFPYCVSSLCFLTVCSHC